MIPNKRKIKILKTIISVLKDYKWCGLCSVNSFLLYEKFTEREFDWMDKLIEDNPPRKKYGEGFYWPPYHNKPRITWLNKRIKELEGVKK